MSKEIKLNLGSGDIEIDGFYNLDLFNKNVDIRSDILNLPFKDNIVDFVLCSHVIDHLDFFQGKKLISEIGRILKHKGKLRIECSNLEEICKKILKVNSEPELMMLFPCLFGFPWVKGEAHKFGYTPQLLEKLLLENNFINIIKKDVIKVEPYSKEKIEKECLHYDNSYNWFGDEEFNSINISLLVEKK